jgi:D-glycero-D-manno-heptose 1,7-bisphosphate phosphatase
MLLRAARHWDIDLTGSYMIGDRWRDVSAGKRAGCKTILIDYGYAEELPDSPDFRVRSLSEAARIILEKPAPVA